MIRTAGNAIPDPVMIRIAGHATSVTSNSVNLLFGAVLTPLLSSINKISNLIK